MKIGEIRFITPDDVRALCISRNYYTSGDNESYSKLLKIVFNMYHDEKNLTTARIVKIAKDIKAHSNTEDRIDDICYYIAKASCTSFMEIE